MNLLNFSHPLTASQLTEIETLVGQLLNNKQDIPVQFDTEQAFATQIIALIEKLNIESVRWQTESWLIVLPALNYAAAILLAELHARMGHFPTIIRLKPVQVNFATQYHIAEIINLEQVRQDARKRR